MENVQYLNEHLWPGVLGHFFVALAFAAALVSAVAYYFLEKENQNTWKSIARYGFCIHSVAVLGIIAMMLSILFGHYYDL